MKSRRRRRRISKEFKIAAVRQLESGKSMAEVARACQVDASMLHRWRVAWEKDRVNAFSEERRVSAASREAELERTIGRLTVENDFLKRALLKLELQRAGGSVGGGGGCTPTSKGKQGGESA
jgi:transposase